MLSLQKRGLRSWIARKTGVNKALITMIFNGHRRTSLKMAPKLEEIFLQNGIPLNRWDLLYGQDIEHRQTLQEYLNMKEVEK